MDICTYRDKIYTDSTLYRHQKSADVFGQFCKEKLGTKRISMEEAKLHVQDFVNWSKKKNHSPSTTKTYLAGVCKALQLNISDYDKPKCFTSEFTRGTKPAKNDAYNEVRAEKAKAVYEHVCADMDAHPERRDYYISEIYKTFQKTGKVLREDLSKDYVCIGKNRQRLISQGRSYTFDRVAVMIVSCWVTNHFRSNVTVNNYIAK